MYQYGSKGKMQSKKSEASTPAAHEDRTQKAMKIPVQTKSLFSPSLNQESDGEKSSSNYGSHPTQLIDSPLQTQLMPTQDQKESQPLPTIRSEQQERLAPRPAQPNNTGIPPRMKESFENLSGFSFDDVKVHYNSDKPAQLQALAYTQGSQVYVAPGQEKHLGHELGHVVQQKRGAAKPTTVVNGVALNDSETLELEADRLVALSASAYNSSASKNIPTSELQRMLKEPATEHAQTTLAAAVVQRVPMSLANIINETTPRPNNQVFRLRNEYTGDFTMHHLVSFHSIRRMYTNLADNDARRQFLLDTLQKYNLPAVGKWFAAGAAMGAVLGGIAGSFLGPAGLGIGILLGAFVGGAIGGLAAHGKRQQVTADVSPYIELMPDIEEKVAKFQTKLENVHNGNIELTGNEANELVSLICWYPSNVVIGPDGIRANDPETEYDIEAAQSIGIAQAVATNNRLITNNLDHNRNANNANAVRNLYLGTASPIHFHKPSADAFELQIPIATLANADNLRNGYDASLGLTVPQRNALNAIRAGVVDLAMTQAYVGSLGVGAAQRVGKVFVDRNDVNTINSPFDIINTSGTNYRMTLARYKHYYAMFSDQEVAQASGIVRNIDNLCRVIIAENQDLQTRKGQLWELIECNVPLQADVDDNDLSIGNLFD